MSSIRTRWAALGAAVAVTLGAGGAISIVDATVSSGERTVFVPITPCRLFDTRPAFQVGPRSSPVGPNETFTATAHGTNGGCTIPTDAVGLSMNVTAVDATLPTFLTIWATGASRPTASSLNPAPGEPPTPNSVTTDLSSGGQFNVYNKQGSVHVFADVTGYYADHNHDDRYYTKTQVDSALTGKANSADVYAVNTGTSKVPSDATVVGFEIYDTSVVKTTASDDISVRLPARARQALVDGRVNFALGSPGALDGDPNCTGSWSAPTAPKDKVCIYPRPVAGQSNVERLEGLALPALADVGFRVRANTPVAAIAGADQYLQFSWAYHAP